MKYPDHFAMYLPCFFTKLQNLDWFIIVQPPAWTLASRHWDLTSNPHKPSYFQFCPSSEQHTFKYFVTLKESLSSFSICHHHQLLKDTCCYCKTGNFGRYFILRFSIFRLFREFFFMSLNQTPSVNKYFCEVAVWGIIVKLKTSYMT